MGRCELVLSVEHATSAIPARYRPLFHGQDKLLSSHRGWDPGAAMLGRRLARASGAPLHLARASRLLVDCNRSRRHARHFSEFTRALAGAEKERILALYYQPFRDAVEREIAAQMTGRRTVLHLSVHSFTPVLNGYSRRADIGLLYDPSRERELAFCLAWQRLLRDDGIVARRNYPYRGVGDGHVAGLRRVFRADRYLGIEIEINQRLILPAGAAWQKLAQRIEQSLIMLLDGRWQG